MKGRLAGACSFALVLCLSGAAQAQAGVRLVLVAGGDQELGRRLLAEAQQAGFEVVVQQGGAQADSAELARRNRAACVLRAAGPGGVELWLVGHEKQPPSTASFRQQRGEAEGFPVRVIE